MKRLLAILAALFAALFNNVEPTEPAMAMNEYSHESYYKIPSGEVPDYRKVYGQDGGVTISNDCNQSHINANVIPITYPDTASTNSFDRGAWLILNQQMAYENMPADSKSATKIGSFDNGRGDTIVAPYICTLKTSPTGSVTGDMMVLEVVHEDTTYTITLNNLNRWWCCFSKKQPDTTDEEGNPIYMHTYQTLADSTFQQGQYLCETTNDTTIEIYNVTEGKQVSIQEFYGKCAKVK